MDLLAMLQLFGVNNEAELIIAKTNNAQKQRLFSSTVPKSVVMSADECKKLCDKIKVEYLPGYENRVREYVTSNETVDRYGDIVRANGGKFENYMKNPVIPYSHKYENLPIGNSLEVWTDKKLKQVLAWGLFMDDRVDTTGFSDLVYKMIASGFLKACSVGFVPMKVNCPSSPEERQKLGLGTWGVEYLEWDYLEWSPCTVPANPEALHNTLKALSKTELKVFEKKDVDVLEKFDFFNDKNLLDIFAETIKSAQTKHELTEMEKFCTENNVCCVEELEMGVVIHPYPNEHACRLSEPSKYEKFRRGTRKSDDKEYSIIFGKLKDEDKWEEQAYRYAKDVWTEAEAKKHCNEHNGISFEPASEKQFTAPVVINVNTDNITTAVEILKELLVKFEKTFNEIDNKLNAIKDVSSRLTSLESKLSMEKTVPKKSIYDEKRVQEILGNPKL